MASRTLRYSLGLVALLAAQWAAAVGLGEIHLRSAMNEPLRAEITLLSVGDLNESQITARLAAPEDFQRAGVEREFQLADIRFNVDLSNSANPVIRVSSQRPMKEPYLNFLLELRWTSGRLLREYTLLLDLPVFSGAPPAGKSAAAAPPAAAVKRPSEQPTSAPARRSPAHGAARTATAANGGYRVQAGDTLWSIAARNQPTGVTQQQAMQAILAANPAAFIQANPNLIRRGAVLEMPGAAAMTAVDHRLAMDRLHTTPPVSDRAVESRTKIAETVVPGSGDGELHLAGGAAGARAGSAAVGGGTLPGGTAGVSRMDIGAVLEEKDRVERENAELKARIASLEEQMNAASRLVEISDPALAALQSGTQPKAPGTATADAGTPIDTAVPGAAPPAVEAPESGQSAESAEQAAVGVVADQTETPGQTPTPPDGSVAASAPVTTGAGDVAAPVAPPRDESPLAAAAELRPWLVPALGLTGVLLLVAMGLAAVRGRATQQDGLQLPSEFEKGVRDAGFDGALTAPVVLDEEDLLPTAPSFHDGPDQILEEVDVCLSFGNEQQASELLTGALERYPAHSGLHLKMLELLAQQGDRAGFETALPKLLALDDRNATESANALLCELQERDVAPGSVIAVADTPAEIAADEIAPTEIAQPETAPAAVAEHLEFDLDLDLGMDLPIEPPVPAATAEKLDVLDDLEDFDLGLRGDDLTGLADVAEAQAVGAVESWQTTSLESDLDLFEPGQEMATQIELAEAYVDMGDAEGAREILDYVLQGGDEAQKESARQLLARLG